MCNDWFTIGPVTVHGYGFMMALGILAGVFVVERLIKKFELPYTNIDSFVFVTLICGFVGAKLFYVLTVLDQFMKDPLSVLGSGGWVVYGAIIGGIVGAYLYSKKKNWNFKEVFDVIIIGLPLAQAIGRIGCFFAGCCYGVETDAWYGVTFPQGSLSPVGVPLVPTQLIMSFGDVLIFLFLLWRVLKKKSLQHTASLYLMLYSVGRFLIEFVRGDRERGHVGMLSTSQFIGIFILMIGIALYFYEKKKEEKAN